SHRARIALLLLLGSSPARVATARDTAPPDTIAPRAASSKPLVTRRDALFAAGAVGLSIASMTSDVWLREEAREDRSRIDRRLAAIAQPLGNLGEVGPALVASYF